MREKKVRAWDKVTESYLYSDDFPSMWQFYKELEYRGIRHFETEDYIGLYDKNGKEIYEGDIIEIAQYSSYAHSWLPYMKAPVTYEVEYGSYCAGDTEVSAFTGRHCEVIGNIKENANLLES